MRAIKKIEMREFNYGYGVVPQNFFLNYSLFKIIVNPSRKVQFSSEKQKDMSDDGSCNHALFLIRKRSFSAYDILNLPICFVIINIAARQGITLTFQIEHTARKNNTAQK